MVEKHFYFLKVNLGYLNLEELSTFNILQHEKTCLPLKKLFGGEHAERRDERVKSSSGIGSL
jgi:hypothetical protein